MRITQVELYKLTPKSVGPVDKMVCWIPSDVHKLKKGLLISLQSLEGIWSIENIYTTQEHYEINRGWNNNI